MRLASLTAAVAATAVIVTACATDRGESLPEVKYLSPDGKRHQLPAPSPDGKRIAYWTLADSGGGWQLWAANADFSAPIKLSVKTGAQFGAQPAIWAPDGLRVASFSGEFGAADVVVAPIDGGPVQRITKKPGIEVPIAWHADNDHLDYYATTPGGTLQAFVISTRTGEERLQVPNLKFPHAAVTSPDGSHIAYNYFDGPKSIVGLADANGGNMRSLTDGGRELFSFPFRPWSPDSKWVLYESTRTGTSDLWIVSVNGGKPRQLTRDVRNDGNGAWSDDGKYVAFTSDRGKQEDLWVVPVDSGAEMRITDSKEIESRPTWLPNSHAIVFHTTSTRASVWVRDLETGAERALSADSLQATWFNVSPDGKNVNYVISRAGVDELMVVPAAGGAPRTIVSGNGLVQEARWSPDGSKIVFTSDRGGSIDVWVVDAAGGAPRQLESWPGFEGAAVWSADGKDIYFTSDRDARLGDVWKVAASGGEPVRVTKDGGINGLIARNGNLFAPTIAMRAGEFGLARVQPNGTLTTVWDRTNTFADAVSPDGKFVSAQVEQADGKTVAMILPASGGAGRVILKPGEQVGAFSYDGTSVLYTMIAGGTTDLGVLNLTDGSTKRVTTTPQDETGAEWFPDGKSIGFLRRTRVQRIVTADLAKLLDRK